METLKKDNNSNTATATHLNISNNNLRSSGVESNTNINNANVKSKVLLKQVKISNGADLVNASNTNMQINVNGPASSAEEHDIFKTLYECTIDMSKYRQFIFYVGTSCDNKKLRAKLKRLQEKLFKNILIQKESILLFFKRNLSNTANDKSGLNDKDKTERLVCFTLATLSYLETLVQKLSRLSGLFPVDESNNMVINLGFEDSSINNAAGDEVIVVNERNSDTAMVAAAAQAVMQAQQQVSTAGGGGAANVVSSSRTAVAPKLAHQQKSNTSQRSSMNKSETMQLVETMENLDLKNRLHMIQHLREEIEQMDTNLVRFNVRTESNEFIKRIKEVGTGTTENSSIHSRKSSKNPTDKTGNGGLVKVKVSYLDSCCNRRKCLYSILITIAIVIIVVAIVLGVVLGLNH